MEEDFDPLDPSLVEEDCSTSRSSGDVDQSLVDGDLSDIGQSLVEEDLIEDSPYCLWAYYDIAVVPDIDHEKKEMHITFPVMHVPDMIGWFLEFAIRNNQGTGIWEYRKIYTIDFLDGMILNPSTSNGVKIGLWFLRLQPQPFREECQVFWLGGNVMNDDEHEGSQVVRQLNDDEHEGSQVRQVNGVIPEELEVFPPWTSGSDVEWLPQGSSSDLHWNWDSTSDNEAASVSDYSVDTHWHTVSFDI